MVVVARLSVVIWFLVTVELKEELAICAVGKVAVVVVGLLTTVREILGGSGVCLTFFV